MKVTLSKTLVMVVAVSASLTGIARATPPSTPAVFRALENANAERRFLGMPVSLIEGLLRARQLVGRSADNQ
jgi:hypothetical protein